MKRGRKSRWKSRHSWDLTIKGSLGSLEETQESLPPQEGVIWFWFPPSFDNEHLWPASQQVIDRWLDSLSLSCLVFTSHISSCLLSSFFCLPLSVLLSFFLCHECVHVHLYLLYRNTHTDSDKLYWQWKLLISTQLYLNNN